MKDRNIEMERLHTALDAGGHEGVPADASGRGFAKYERNDEVESSDVAPLESMMTL